LIWENSSKREISLTSSLSQEKRELSLVIPVFNGKEYLESVVGKLKKFLDLLDISWEIILIDDGSGDDSFALIQKLHLSDARIGGGRLKQNRGQQNALYAGLTLSRGEYVITMDDDGQHGATEIPRLIEKAREGYDVVYMVRERDSRSFLYRWGTKINLLFFRLFLGKPPQLKIGSFRLIRRRVIEKILHETTSFVSLSALIFRRAPLAKITHLFYGEQPSLSSSIRIGLGKRVLLFWRLFLYYGPLPFKNKKEEPFQWEFIL
jgi:polyisoprenyl-phosphate glycosyltransferase